MYWFNYKIVIVSQKKQANVNLTLTSIKKTLGV